MSGDLLPRRPPVVTFSGGPHRFEADQAGAPRFAVAYTVPRNTLDPRHAACTDHHVACDCREAELNEQLEENRLEWAALRDAARRVLAGHQLETPAGLEDWQRRRYKVCMCSGCVIERTSHNLLSWADVDYHTGRVLDPEPRRARCTCAPHDTPRPDCDVHGQPSAAYDAGRRAGARQEQDRHRGYLCRWCQRHPVRGERHGEPVGLDPENPEAVCLDADGRPLAFGYSDEEVPF